MKQKFARVATIALVLISGFFTNLQSADAGYNFWKWLNFGSDRDSTDFTVAFDNRAPSVPTFIGPTDGGYTADTTPTLSANYIDVDVADVGTTDYRIALSAFGCRSNTSVITSGSSAETTTISETTSWTVTSALTNDGTYFWCASNNDGVLSSAWVSGSGDGWSFILDTTAPTTSAAVTTGTEGNNAWYTTNAEVTLTETDALSGVASTVYCTDQTNTCTPTANYSTPITVATEGTNYVRYFSTDNVANVQSVQSLTVKVDKSNPSGGSISHTDGYETDTTITITVAAGTDSISGMSADDSDYLLEYQSATLTAGACGAFGDWTDSAASETADATGYDFTATTGNCYKFHYIVTDVASNTTTYTSDSTTKVEATTPDIVAVDAGAASADRVSLTSATWFKYTDTGSDDLVSFSWTDSDSASDDTFYYELTESAEDSITGDESNVATNYIDDITVAEGTNYFHVRPQNGAATFGTERIFTVNYDKTNPTTAVTIAEVTYGVEFNHAATINGTAADATSGVSLTEIKIQESSTSNYWTGSAWTASETWVAATEGTTTWTYTLDDENFTTGLTYTITARATDAAGNVTATSLGSDSFLYSTGNVAPNAPTLVSPADASFTADTTPALSAHYSDDDIDDVGTTNYRVATSAENCLAGTVVASGASAETATDSEATTWSASSSLGSDGTYYWCAQNDDSTMQSAWTAMGSFILDATNPVLTDLELTSNETYFEDAGISVTSGLVGYWKMDEASWVGTADEVVDYSGNANHGTAAADATTATGGKFKKAGTFDGTGDYVTVTDAASLKGMSAISVGFWINPSTSQTGGVIDKNRSTEWNVHLADSKVRFEGSNVSSSAIRFTSDTTIDPNAWTFVAVVYENSTKAVYYNGVSQSVTINDNATGALYSSTNPIYLGRMHDGYYFNGLIDDVAVYNRALTSTEITNIYTKRLAYFNSLSAEGSGQTVTVTTVATETNPTSWLCASAFGDTPNADTSAPYTQTYSVETDAATQTDKTCIFTDAAGNTAATSLTYTQDNVDPTGGSVSHSDTPQASTTIAVTVAAGTDATSGLSVAASDYLLEQRNATATGGSCGTYSSWTNASVTETADATSYDFTATSGKCYQFRYTVTDKVGNATTYTSSNTTIVDATTPDIVAVDAGASTEDRVSLTSDTWFRYTDTGSDDLVSFSWTDSASPSDDTFYYELNSTATATVTGDESNAATAYIDSITVAEGTNYFHVRPKNGAGTFGTEQIFIVKYDKTIPTGGSTTHTDGYENDTTLAVTVSAGSDAGSGMSTTSSDYTLEYHLATLSAGSCGSYGSWTNASVSETYNATAYDFTSTGGNCYQMRYIVTDTAGNEATWTSTTTTKVDTSAPTTPSLSYTDGFTATAAQDVTFASTDGESGVASLTLYYRDATLAGGTCDSFGAWNSLGVQTSPYSHSMTTEKCYQYKVTATNNADLASTKDDSTEVTKVDTATPDILAVDAGSGTDDNRTSLTSDTWFDYADTGSDDLVSFSWTDPSSTSDDTFYYELNSTATATIDGTESSVATAYIDSITVAEGSNYFHVRPRNAALTWGTERIFIVKYDKTNPTTSAAVTAGTEGDNSWYTTDAEVTITPADAISGIASTVYCTDQADSCTPETSYSTAITIATDGTNYVRYFSTDSVGNIQATQSLTVKVDKTDPTVETDTLISPNGGEIWTGGGGATYDITWTAADFTDATSDLTATPITIDYSVNSGTDWTEIATGEANDGIYTWTTPDLTDEEVQIRVTATDVSGNSSSDTSDADFRLSAHDNWIALYVSEGNNQSGGIDETLTTDFKARVGNGADSGETYAGADAVTVTFTIATTPIEPTAIGQSLANGSFGTTFGGTSTAKTVTTDADGYVSVVTTLGDRAGDYAVVGSFTGVETVEASRTFTATERETFKFTISNPILSIDVDPMVNSTGSSSTTLSVTTNAASYQININPTAWPVYDEETIQNWSGGFGFGWDNNDAGTSGGTSEASAFDGLDTPTDAYVCSGDTCQGTVEFTLDFHTAVDYSYEAGTYENTLTVEGANISF